LAGGAAARRGGRFPRRTRNHPSYCRQSIECAAAPRTLSAQMLRDRPADHRRLVAAGGGGSRRRPAGGSCRVFRTVRMGRAEGAAACRPCWLRQRCCRLQRRNNGARPCPRQKRLRGHFAACRAVRGGCRGRSAPHRDGRPLVAVRRASDTAAAAAVVITAARSEPPHQTRALRVGMREIALTQPPGTCDEIWDFGLGLPAATGTVDCRSRPVAVIFLYFAPALWCLKRGRTQPADSSIFDRKMLRTPQARHHTQRFVPDSLKLRTARFEHAHRWFAEQSHTDHAIK